MLIDACNPMLCQKSGLFLVYFFSSFFFFFFSLLYFSSLFSFVRCQIATGRELAASSALSLLGSRTGGAHLGLDVARPKRGLLREVRAFMTQHFAVYKGVLQFGAATESPPQIMIIIT